MSAPKVIIAIILGFVITCIGWSYINDVRYYLAMIRAPQVYEFVPSTQEILLSKGCPVKKVGIELGDGRKYIVRIVGNDNNRN